MAIDGYVCHFCGTLETIQTPITYKNLKFCSKECLKLFKRGKKYKQKIPVSKKKNYIPNLKKKLLLGKISYLDISKELRDKIDGKKKIKKHTLNNKCVICDTIFYTDIKHLRKTCSEKCLSIFQKQIGEKYSLLYCGFAANGWKGGIHNYPYCPKFNEDLKTRVRTFFDNKCFNCGKTQTENKKALCVHHVNYNKNACCDETPALFVSLCDSCHGKTNKNREYWENVFEEKLRNEYNYKCYYTQEEYINYKINNI